MKQPLFSIITDLHIEDQNREEVKKVVIESIDKSLSLNINTIFIAGDVFDTRKSLSFNIIQTWDEILTYGEEQGMYFIIIPGNHDKLDYTSERSYLDVYRHYPNVTLCSDYYTKYFSNDTRVHLIPFFDEKSTYDEYFKRIKINTNKTNYLITHIAINGVSNNDGSIIDEAFTPNSFSMFDKVFVGHYHNKQDVLSNIHYIGSIMQNNYGEDEDKGMTVVYDDGSHDQIQLSSTKYTTVKIDIDKITDKDLKDLCIKCGNSEDNIRFKFEGSKAKLDALDKTKYDDLGIDVKCKSKDPNIDLSYKDAANFTGFDSEKIKEEWSEFSTNNEEIDEKIGTQYLEGIL